MQGQLYIFGLWLLRIVDDSDALNAVAVITLILRPAVGCLNWFRGLIARVVQRTIMVAILGVTSELPRGRTSLIPIWLLVLLLERSLTAGGLGRLAEAHFG